MDTTVRIRLIQDFLGVYKQSKSPSLPDEKNRFLSDEVLRSFTDNQLDDLRLIFEESSDAILLYQRKLEHDKATKNICQRIFNLAIEDGALPQQIDEKVMGLELLVQSFFNAGASTEEAWILAHAEYENKIRPLLRRKSE